MRAKSESGDVQTCIDTYKDLSDWRARISYPGRHAFLEANRYRTHPKWLIHAISYSIKDGDVQDTIIEIFLDQICIAAQRHFPKVFETAVIHMVTEELLGQFCLSEFKLRWRNKSVGELFSASIVDEIIDNVVEGSYSKKTRDRSAKRLLAKYSRT